jgi:ribose 5-phosphate isomerase B
VRIHIASDHAAFDLKEHLVVHLREGGNEVVDHGPPSYQPEDDYPVHIIPAAQAVLVDPGSRGIVLGGSGNGEQMAAHRVPGIRAALVWSVETARLARAHNDAQVMGIGARMHTLDEATSLVDVFLSEPFSEDPRHVRRLQIMADWEAAHVTVR